MTFKITNLKNLFTPEDLTNYQLYRSTVLTELRLEIEKSKNSPGFHEKDLQQFFEQHPCALLGAIRDVPCNHNIFGNMVISQPQIKNYTGDRKPDFLIVTRNSQVLYFNFIEIECPSKKIFVSDGKVELTTQFHKANDQLHQWIANEDSLKSYCEHLKSTLFEENFDLARKTDTINYVLLYGDSSELTATSSVRRNQFLKTYFTDRRYHGTFSGLINDFQIPGGMFCVKRNPDNDTYEALGMVPFKKYGTSEWSDFHNITGKSEIISNCNFLSGPEKQKLLAEIATLDNKNRSEIDHLQQLETGTDVNEGLDDILL
jgi:hypothetical protein